MTTTTNAKRIAIEKAVVVALTALSSCNAFYSLKWSAGVYCLQYRFGNCNGNGIDIIFRLLYGILNVGLFADLFCFVLFSLFFLVLFYNRNNLLRLSFQRICKICYFFSLCFPLFHCCAVLCYCLHCMHCGVLQLINLVDNYEKCRNILNSCHNTCFINQK